MSAGRPSPFAGPELLTLLPDQKPESYFHPSPTPSAPGPNASLSSLCPPMVPTAHFSMK